MMTDLPLNPFAADAIPLIVGLNETLISTDVLYESTLDVVHRSPASLLCIPYWLLLGKSELKKKLAFRQGFDPALLPFNQELLSWLRTQKASGRKLVLYTATDRSIAQPIADYLGLFDEVVASNGAQAQTNKAESLIARYGARQFDYVGNASRSDQEVWRQARRAVLVHVAARLAAKIAAECEIERLFPPPAFHFSAIGKVLRIHQWMKNLLLFVPLLAAHQLGNGISWLAVSTAFLAFSLCASSVYIFNDLLDLSNDRKHPRKSKRPFASGLVSARAGILSSFALLFSSLFLTRYVGGSFLPWLIFYFALTCVYSWGLKRLLLVDCLTLAMLYTLRIVAGAAAASMSLSFWLLAFAVFLFLSLAFVKRYAELEAQRQSGSQKIHGRGYETTDAPLIQTLGVTSGYASVLVLALYLNSDAVVKLYRTPEFIWGTVPVMLFWISWMWMQAHRGKMHDDPLVFAVKDKASLLAGFAFAAVLIAGAVWSW